MTEPQIAALRIALEALNERREAVGEQERRATGPLKTLLRATWGKVNFAIYEINRMLRDADVPS